MATSLGEGSVITDRSNVPNIQSLISVLKTPKHSKISHFRCIAVNPKCTNRSSGSCSSDPQSVSLTQRARQFSSEYVGVSGVDYSTRHVMKSFHEEKYCQKACQQHEVLCEKGEDKEGSKTRNGYS